MLLFRYLAMEKHMRHMLPNIHKHTYHTLTFNKSFEKMKGFCLDSRCHWDDKAHHNLLYAQRKDQSKFIFKTIFLRFIQGNIFLSLLSAFIWWFHHIYHSSVIFQSKHLNYGRICWGSCQFNIELTIGGSQKLYFYRKTASFIAFSIENRIHARRLLENKEKKSNKYSLSFCTCCPFNHIIKYLNIAADHSISVFFALFSPFSKHTTQTRTWSNMCERWNIATITKSRWQAKLKQKRTERM